MTFHSSNSEEYEKCDDESIITIIRSGMEAGCISPSHLYDAVDELICRVQQYAEMKKRINEVKADNTSKRDMFPITATWLNETLDYIETGKNPDSLS